MVPCLVVSIVCCSVLQCVAVCRSVLQCVAECRSVLQSDVVCSNVLQRITVECGYRVAKTHIMP